MQHDSAKRGFPKRLIITVVVIGVALYAGSKLMGGKGEAGGGMAAMMGGAAPVSVAEVVTKQVIEWREFSGMFEAVNAVEIRPRVGGYITAIHFKDGEEVKKGQPLFTIDPRPYEAAMISAKGAMNEADAAYARAKKLITSKAISSAEFEGAQSAYERALGNYKAAQVNLEYTRITAPIAGKISRAEITVGNLVEPAAGPLLASIVDLSPIYASFDIDEQTFLGTIQGKPAVQLKNIPVEVGLGNAAGANVSARIHSFDNQITPGSGTIRVRAILDNKDQTIVPGLYARVRVGEGEAADAVLIHPGAVGTDQDKKFVLVVDAESKAQYRPVVLGQMVDKLQVVKSGLAAGDKIVVSGLQRARPGSPITPNEVNMETLEPLNPPPAAEGAAPAADAAKAEDKPAEKPAE